jgi:hypothetical protein
MLGSDNRHASAIKQWNMKRTTASIRTVFAFFTLAACIAALHSTISALLLKLPFHHCVFCLGQHRWDVLVAFCLIFVGVSLYTICAWLKAAIDKWTACSDVTGPIDRMVKWAGILLITGTTILSITLMISITKGG